MPPTPTPCPQAVADVAGELQGLRLRTLSVGGLAGDGGTVEQGFRGCLQVRARAGGVGYRAGGHGTLGVRAEGWWQRDGGVWAWGHGIARGDVGTVGGHGYGHRDVGVERG